MLTNVLGFLAEYFHRYLSYFHLIKDDKSRSISNKGVTSRKGFQFIRVKVKKLLFFLQNLISGINLGSIFYNYTLATLHEKLGPFCLPKILFSNFQNKDLALLSSELYM